MSWLEDSVRSKLLCLVDAPVGVTNQPELLLLGDVLPCIDRERQQIDLAITFVGVEGLIRSASTRAWVGLDLPQIGLDPLIQHWLLTVSFLNNNNNIHLNYHLSIIHN